MSKRAASQSPSESHRKEGIYFVHVARSLCRFITCKSVGLASQPARLLGTPSLIIMGPSGNFLFIFHPSFVEFLLYVNSANEQILTFSREPPPILINNTPTPLVCIP